MTNNEVIRLAEKQIEAYEILDMTKTVNGKAWTTLKTALEIIEAAHDIVFDKYTSDVKITDLQNLLEGATNIWED